VNGRPDYCAPAATVLTLLHVVDPSAPWVHDLKGDGTTYGSTMCGLPMLTAQSWQLIEQLPGEKVCPQCLGEAPDASCGNAEAMF
jgi:hypothetical protein